MDNLTNPAPQRPAKHNYTPKKYEPFSVIAVRNVGNARLTIQNEYFTGRLYGKQIKKRLAYTSKNGTKALFKVNIKPKV